MDDREFELLLEATYRMDDDYFGLESRFIVLAAGRLGLRSGEICHMREEWLNERRRMIVIPAHQSCQKGKDGGICGACEQSARQKAEHNDDVDLEQARESMWSPKTSAAAREVPFDAEPRAELAVERYLDKYGRFQASQTAINRRVTRAAEIAEELDPDMVTPHGLRATAATRFASRGLDTVALQSMFGWSNLSTAHNYIRRSGEATARAIRDIQF
ncbi:tyrosine-type recombinase/integrase [Haloarcula sp. CBA1127]|uniref:tyrosine-type recombinase/integrase n=1 Tax=Haloarcula sp. CBA1127 TaxID=1765055 RepID=UPI0021011A13|nr:tyrosine-type recombinase/integrase [Haloarcula sp. CBA1127]